MPAFDEVLAAKHADVLVVKRADSCLAPPEVHRRHLRPPVLLKAVPFHRIQATELLVRTSHMSNLLFVRNPTHCVHKSIDHNKLVAGSLVIHRRSIDESLPVFVEEEIVVQIKLERWHVSSIEIVESFRCAHLCGFNWEIETIPDED